MSKKALYSEGPLLYFLRSRRGWSLERLGQAFDMTGPAVHHFESGRRPLPPERLADFAAAMSYTEPEIRLHRRTVEARALLDAEGKPGAEGASLPLDPEERRVRAAAAEHSILSSDQFGRDLGGLLTETSTRALRREAARAFRVWIVAPRSEQRLLVEDHQEYQTQGMVEQVGLASIRAAAKDPRMPLHYAQLAVQAAERLPGPPELRSAVQGWAWAFVGNAHRVAASLREADQAFGHSGRLWRSGAGAKGLFLERWRLPDLEASLRRDQRLWKECLALTDQALEEASESARGRILVSKAFALQQMGLWAPALPFLLEATPLVEARGDAAVQLSLWMNLAVSLTHLQKLTEAEKRLNDARRLAQELGKDLELVRCVWISALILGYKGDPRGAVVALGQARANFTARQMPLEAAAVALDEAVYLLEMKATQRVSDLAREVAWIFTAEGVGEEALKAFRLFYEAARGQQITLEAARLARERFLQAA